MFEQVHGDRDVREAEEGIVITLRGKEGGGANTFAR